MTETYMSQAEADGLLSMEKHNQENQVWDYPSAGRVISIPLISPDRSKNFLLDISTARIKLAKGTYQNRYSQVIILARLDFNGPPHRNPDDEEIGTPHLHIYREGYGDKFAMELPSDKFSDPQDTWQLLQDFMKFCNITQFPDIQRGLFT